MRPLHWRSVVLSLLLPLSRSLALPLHLACPFSFLSARLSVCPPFAVRPSHRRAPLASQMHYRPLVRPSRAGRPNPTSKQPADAIRSGRKRDASALKHALDWTRTVARTAGRTGTEGRRAQGCIVGALCAARGRPGTGAGRGGRRIAQGKQRAGWQTSGRPWLRRAVVILPPRCYRLSGQTLKGLLNASSPLPASSLLRSSQADRRQIAASRQCRGSLCSLPLLAQINAGPRPSWLALRGARTPSSLVSARTSSRIGAGAGSDTHAQSGQTIERASLPIRPARSVGERAAAKLAGRQAGRRAGQVERQVEQTSVVVLVALWWCSKWLLFCPALVAVVVVVPARRLLVLVVVVLDGVPFKWLLSLGYS